MANLTLPTSLLLNGREFAYADIQQYPGTTPVSLNGYEGKVLDFVRQWLNGSQEFGLRTSGSTGQPQAIQLRRRQLEASARRTGDYFDLGPGDRLLVCLNCEYIGGQMMLVRGLARNMHLTIVEPHADPLALVSTDAAFDFASFVPLQLRTLLAGGYAERLNQLKAILVGGAAVDASLAKAVRALTVPVYLTYGMTETASHIALCRLNGPDATTAYKVLPGIHVAQDARHCLTVRADVTDDKLITTNDRIKLLDAHTFEWLGRADFVINSGGVKVPAEKVEQVLEVALAELELNRRAFVTGMPDERLGQTVTAVLEGPPLTPEEEARLLSLLRNRLAKYERPRQLRYAAKFRETASGKLDRPGTVRGLDGTAPATMDRRGHKEL